jgi:gliding motility-associatede transport system auxiliary component
MTTPHTDNAASSPPALLAVLSRNRKNTGYALLVIAVLFALIPLWMVYHYKLAGAKPADVAATEDKKSTDETQPAAEKELRYVPVMLWGGALALIFMGGGVWYLLTEETSPLNEIDATRLMVLTIGGLSGLVTVLFIGLALPYFEWWSIFIGTVETWRKEWWKIGATMLALFGGLALMFASLQLARTDERSSPGLRRLLYGYNAVLTGLLVLAILVVLNVSTYVTQIPAWGAFFSKPSDWTASNIFTLSTESRNVLASIDKPVKVYVLLAKRDPFYNEVETLMSNVRAVNRKIEVEYVPPDSRPATADELIRKYELPDSMGILVVYGEGPRPDHEFIPTDELGNRGLRTGEKLTFNGENALVTKLTQMSEGKSRSIVYFTQGAGELELKDTARVPDRGLAVLSERLEKANYQVKELRLDDPTFKAVPDDAAVVVIARPSRPLSPSAINALRSYLSPAKKDGKQGKLIVLMDVVTNRDGTIVQTGLEPFLAEYGVQVNNDRILTFNNGITVPPLQIFAVANQESRNPVALSFARDLLLFSGVRTVDPKPSDPSTPRSYTAQSLLLSPDKRQLVEKPALQADPLAYLEGMIKDEANMKEVESKLIKKPLSIAVAVTQPKGPENFDDPHARLNQKQDPLLVVFGDAGWVSNQEVSRNDRPNFDLFVSLLSWLRERPEIGKKAADAKERPYFTMSTPPEGIVRLQWLPGFLICLAIVGLGGGIWLVRRR